MSVLRDRIMGQGQAASLHPHGTGATPMVMPMSEHQYAGEQALYGMVHPLVTADGAVIPARSHAQVTWASPAPVVPAGRP